ncbi:acyltransferase [Sphingomonas naphthae]|uniref:Acyltransferase n=1 Tax=Sphingomonas naphthae TaxID=1813468 RepID=A0ABY7TKU4_9SPHN|nr:acyltransferase [Sphingomonas naphthae]WCT73861.1 acyltransferase [Sphingomonas naphthae]
MKFQRIQQLRLVAALAVVAFHALGTGTQYLPDETAIGFVRYGDLGVDLFFVISGFIICVTATSRERDWRLFLRRRLTRIVPLYWLATSAMILLLLALPGLIRTPGDLSWGQILQSFTFTTSFVSGGMPIVYLGWSLEYEMLFYLLGAVAMAGLRNPWQAMPLFLAALVVGGAILQPAADTVARHLLWPMLLEFALGVLIGSAITTGLMPWSGMAAVAVGLASLQLYPPEHDVWRVHVAGAVAAVVVLLAVLLDRRQPVRSAAGLFVAAGGDASYSIYLVQVFTVPALAKAAAWAWPTMPLDLFIPLTMIATDLAGLAACHLAERPIVRRLRERPPPATLATA